MSGNMHRIPDTKMDDEDMSHNSGWSGSGTVQSGPAGYPGGSSGGFAAGGRQPLPYQQTYGSGQSVSSEGDISLKRDREREGRCSECGVQTHEFRVDPSTGQQRKIPLTVENEVHRGRCLFCHPFPGFVPSAPGGGSSTGSGGNQVDNISHHTTGSGSGSGGHSQTNSGNFSAFRSTRSINTVSSHGGSVHSGAQPDQIESSVASTVSNTAADEALSLFDNESCDLLDILTAMRRFPNERRIQEKGCEKLWIQSWDDENSSAIGRVGGISILLNAMASFPTSQRLQQSGCEALQNLALNDFNRDAIVEHGGIRVIVNAMNNHQEVVGVQQCGCTALANLAVSRDNHLDIANAGGLHAIMNAAQNNQDEESVLRAAYQALRAMGYDPNRHGPGAQPQQQQPQQQPPPQQEQQDQPMEVIRLDVHGFPIN